MGQVLLIDDETGVFLSVQAVLHGHQVVWAQDEKEVECSIAKSPPHVIILDYLLGRTESIPGILLWLRGQLPFTPILVLSGRGNEEVIIQAFRAGADEYVKKPFDVEDFRCRIEMFLSGPPARKRPSHTQSLIPSCRSPLPLTSVHPALRRAIQAWTPPGISRRSLTSLAHVAGVSKRHLIRLFWEAAGTSPRRFFERQAVGQAASLLRSTRLPICEISDLLGFSDASHFARVFRKHTGVPPGAFRLNPK